MATCLARSLRELSATHFLTLRRGSPGMTSAQFSRALFEFFRAFKRRCPEGLHHIVVNEWKGGVRHAHALIRLLGKLSTRALARAVKEAKEVAGIHCSIQAVRNPIGAAYYLFKHTRLPERKADLTPAGFGGRMYSCSRGFLTKPFKELWAEAKAELAERKSRGRTTPTSG